MNATENTHTHTQPHTHKHTYTHTHTQTLTHTHTHTHTYKHKHTQTSNYITHIYIHTINRNLAVELMDPMSDAAQQTDEDFHTQYACVSGSDITCMPAARINIHSDI